MRSTVNRSKGKRAKKRKRLKDGSTSEAGRTQDTRVVNPDLTKFVTIGFNSTMRHLETLAQKAAPSSLVVNRTAPVTAEELTKSQKPGQSDTEVSSEKQPLAIFVPYMKQSSKLYAHLPILVKTASMAFPHLPAIRLVTLPVDAENRLSEALKIPRVGLIGLECDAPGVSALAEMIRANVPELIVPWLQESKAGAYLRTDIKAIYPNAYSDHESVGREKI